MLFLRLPTSTSRWIFKMMIQTWVVLCCHASHDDGGSTRQCNRELSKQWQTMVRVGNHVTYSDVISLRPQHMYSSSRLGPVHSICSEHRIHLQVLYVSGIGLSLAFLANEEWPYFAMIKRNCLFLSLGDRKSKIFQSELDIGRLSKKQI